MDIPGLPTALLLLIASIAMFPYAAAAITTYRANITGLPNATVPNVSGTVVAFQDGTAIGYGGFLSGLQPELDASSCDATNGCGVHVHEGKSCESTEAQGLHYYNSTVVEVDPWLEARYSSDANGAAVFSGLVIPGVTDLEGRAFVVHAEDGSRIACGILELVEESQSLSADTNALTEPESGTGSVVVYPLDGADTGRVCFMGSAFDLEANLVSTLTADGDDCSAANGCGAHVHEGMDCTNSTTQLGHFYNSEELDEDPWSLVGYLSTNEEGFAYFMDCLEPQVQDYDGRAFIVHDNNGTRVSCGLLQRGASTTLAPTVSPAPTGVADSTMTSSVIHPSNIGSLVVLIALLFV